MYDQFPLSCFVQFDTSVTFYYTTYVKHLASIDNQSQLTFITNKEA